MLAAGWWWCCRLQVFLLLISFAAVPCMLLPKPLILKKRHEAAQNVSVAGRRHRHSGASDTMQQGPGCAVTGRLHRHSWLVGATQVQCMHWRHVSTLVFLVVFLVVFSVLYCVLAPSTWWPSSHSVHSVLAHSQHFVMHVVLWALLRHLYVSTHVFVTGAPGIACIDLCWCAPAPAQHHPHVVTRLCLVTAAHPPAACLPACLPQRHQRYVMVDLDHEEDEEATRGLVGGAHTSGGGHGESTQGLDGSLGAS